MSAKNQYLEKQRQRDQSILDAGEDMGMQKMWDYIQIALREPDVVGKDVFGKARFAKLYKKCMELADHYKIAFTDHVEADVRQDELDGVLKEVWEDELVPFHNRYPYLKKAKYDKPKKGWV